MNRMVPTSGQPGDEVDALLTAFYRKEMPAPWPAFRPPASRAGTAPLQAPPPLPLRRPGPSLSPARGLSFGRSRLALAASVALIVFGTWCVPGLLPGHGARLASDSKSVPIDAKQGTAKTTGLDELLVAPDGVRIRINVKEDPSPKTGPQK